MKITYPQILKTGEKIAVRTSASAVFTKQGDTVQDHLNIIDDANLVVLDEEEQTEFNPPESDINDNIISVASTWSSKKINDTIDGLQASMNFYIPLTETSNDVYTTDITVSEIELAYQAGKAIWVIASEIFLPLRQRVDVNHWIFSGYTDTQAYDIQISNTGVTITYKELVTTNDTLPNPSVLRLTGAVSAVYDGSTEVEVDIPNGGNVPLENGDGENSIQQTGNTASAENSFAIGQGTMASATAQAVVGKYNAENTNALFQVGNGTSDTTRSNAFEVISTTDGTSIKVGDTILTESQLQQLLAILTNNLAEGEY